MLKPLPESPSATVQRLKKRFDMGCALDDQQGISRLAQQPCGERREIAQFFSFHLHQSIRSFLIGESATA
jgi:hypothetical protein